MKNIITHSESFVLHDFQLGNWCTIPISSLKTPEFTVTVNLIAGPEHLAFEIDKIIHAELIKNTR